MKTVLTWAAGLVAVSLLAVYLTGVVVVEVRENGPDGTHLVIPVPLAVAHTALLFVDKARTRIDCPRFAPYREAAMRLARELQDSPDGRFVEVEGPGRRVTIEKSGDVLQIEVREGDDQQVHVLVPVAGLEDVISSYDGQAFSIADVLWVVRKLPAGECLRVHDGDNQVRIWVL